MLVDNRRLEVECGRRLHELKFSTYFGAPRDSAGGTLPRFVTAQQEEEAVGGGAAVQHASCA
jgi:hypothetical protein